MTTAATMAVLVVVAATAMTGATTMTAMVVMITLKIKAKVAELVVVVGWIGSGREYGSDDKKGEWGDRWSLL